MQSEDKLIRHQPTNDDRKKGHENNSEGLEVIKEQSDQITDKVLQKRKDLAKPVNSNVPASARERFEMTNMSVQEASERFKTTDRDRAVDGQPAEENLCFICFTAEPNIVFLDCGHGGSL